MVGPLGRRRDPRARRRGPFGGRRVLRGVRRRPPRDALRPGHRGGRCGARGRHPVRAHADAQRRPRCSATCSPTWCATTWPRSRPEARRGPRRGGRRRDRPVSPWRTGCSSATPRSRSRCWRPPTGPAACSPTSRSRGLRIPAGPDSFVARKPWAVDLCRELGLDLVAPASSGAWLWTPTGLVRYASDTAFGIPGDPGTVFRWPGLSGRGRRRALRDLLLRTRKDPSDETLGALLRRRLGDEATDRAIAPLLGGLYAGDVDRLVGAGDVPRARRVGARAGVADPRSPSGDAPCPGRRRDADVPAPCRGGVGAARRARRAARRPGRHRGPGHVGAEPSPAAAGGSRATVPAAGRATPWSSPCRRPRPGRCSSPSPAPPPRSSRTSARVSTGVVALVYPDGTADALPDGTGFVVPRGAAPFTAVTWLSNKWPDRAYGSRAVLRCFVGADGDEDVLDAPDADIVRGVRSTPVGAAAAARAASIQGHPVAGRRCRSSSWATSTASTRLRGHLPPGVVVTGPPYDGVGVPDCVRAAGEAAARRARPPEEPPVTETTSTRCTPCSRRTPRAARPPAPTPTIARRAAREIEDLYKSWDGPGRRSRHVLHGRVPRRRRPDALARRLDTPTTSSAFLVGVPPHRGGPAARSACSRSWGS